MRDNHNSDFISMNTAKVIRRRGADRFSLRCLCVSAPLRFYTLSVYALESSIDTDE